MNPEKLSAGSGSGGVGSAEEPPEMQAETGGCVRATEL